MLRFIIPRGIETAEHRDGGAQSVHWGRVLRELANNIDDALRKLPELGEGLLEFVQLVAIGQMVVVQK